jgi:hypothetical protein
MSIRWIRNSIIEAQIGEECYARIWSEVEKWFKNLLENRSEIITRGIDILKKRFERKKAAYPDGRDYDWA